METRQQPEPHGSPRWIADPRTRRLLMLTFVTGIVDTVTFLGLGQVFSAMQTGNVIFLGFGIAGSADTSIVAPLIALGAFVVGGSLAAGLAAGGDPSQARGPRAAMVVEVLLLGAAAVVAAVVDVVPDEPAAYASIGLLAMAMGLRNTVARRVGGPNLATTVLNLTFTAFTAHSAMSVASGRDLTERVAAVLAILTGAITGALLLKTSLALPIAAAVAITLAARVGHLRTRDAAYAHTP
jgi:uncharacterized membrane protein YoaK (UPF0700 family)